jgi:hypothetical protein
MFVISILILRTIYGPSYYFLSGEDCWMPDSHGGWVKHGVPYEPPPKETSINIPILVMYIPVILAGLSVFCLFGPFRQKLLKKQARAF